jgi:Na+-transporting methylmalonyl-CoA/oxaloacetate decarboxylase gamma subunit
MIKLFSVLKRATNRMGLAMAFVVNSLFLLAVYILGVGATSIAAKTMSKNFFETKTSSEITSYWSDSDPQKRSFSDHFKQF